MFGPVLIICISLILFFALLHNAGKCLDSKKWPTTKGEIIYNKVHTRVTTTGTDVSDVERWNHPVSSLLVEYKYKVRGKEYRSSTLKFLRGESNNYFIEKLIGRKYPVGKQVTVHYNLRNPNEACLEPGLSVGAILGFVIVIMFFVAGVAFAVTLA